MDVRAMPMVYFARAVDGLVREEILAEADALGAELEAAGLRLIDPVAAWWSASGDRGTTPRVEDLVRSDLGLLRRSDGVLMDLSLPMRDYVGCICELTYAHMWQIPSVIWVGDTGLDQRVWLRYHATAIVPDKVAAISSLRRLLTDRPGSSSPTG